MVFTVSKRKWLRDRTADKRKPKYYIYPGGQLLDTDGKMCCLGFCAIQLGAPKTSLLGMGMPYSLKKAYPVISKLVIGKVESTQLSIQAADINDDDSTTSDEKITKLTTLFKKFGHEIIFVP